MISENRNLSRRRFLKAGIGSTIALAGDGSGLFAKQSDAMNSTDAKAIVRITPGKNRESDRQTIYFEYPALPDQVFRLVIPELVSDTESDPMPWGLASPGTWVVKENHAAFTDTVKDTIRADVDVVFQGERVEARVKVTNLTNRLWKNSNAFTCFFLKQAPLFSDPALDRTFVPIGGRWEKLSDVVRADSIPQGALTAYEPGGGPDLDSLWLLSQIKNRYSGKLDHGSVCVVSSDGRWIAGMTAPQPAYVFNNPGLPCIHADPLLGDVAPGKTGEGRSILHVFKGTIDDFSERCRLDRETYDKMEVTR